ncbi:3178_t:CDS:2 [Gigaspora rosea]|nr:3178_t:CDS:2 [Gigaspora rosea]
MKFVAEETNNEYTKKCKCKKESNQLLNTTTTTETPGNNGKQDEISTKITST